MAQALQGLPRPLRAGVLVAVLSAVAALVMVQWVRQADAARENERLYEQCLSHAQDVAHVKSCTADFYTRWDGRLGTADATALALEAQRLVELRTTAAEVTRPTLPAPTSAPVTPGATTPAPATDVADPDAPAPAAGAEEASHDDGDHAGEDPASTPKGDGTPSTRPTQGASSTMPSTPGTPDPRPVTEAEVMTDAKPTTRSDKDTKRSEAVTDLPDALDLAASSD